MFSQYNFKEIKDPYMYRLASEHVRLDKLSHANPDMVSIMGVEFSKKFPHPPVQYEVTYNLTSYTGIDEEQHPRQGKEHKMQLRIPINFPEQPAECKMVSDTWHPNIKSGGPFKGSICTNHKGFGALFFLDELVIRIGEFLQYKKYMAEDREPWPEDQKVARWVREVAEPKAWVDRRKGLFLDERPWIHIDELLKEEEEPTEDAIQLSEKTEPSTKPPKAKSKKASNGDIDIQLK